MFLRIYPKKHEARSAVIDLSLGSSKNVFENSFEETTSVERSRRKNHGVSRHTKKAQKVVGLCDFLFKPLARSIFDRLLPKGRKKDWRGVGEWSEAPSYEEGVGGDGGLQDLSC